MLGWDNTVAIHPPRKFKTINQNLARDFEHRLIQPVGISVKKIPPKHILGHPRRLIYKLLDSTQFSIVCSHMPASLSIGRKKDTKRQYSAALFSRDQYQGVS